jgi:uncharacterized protein (DUF433 family)
VKYSPTPGCTNQPHYARWFYLQFRKFLTVEHVPRITNFCICMYVFWCKLSVCRLCDSDFGITAVDDITIGIACAVFCFHIAQFHSPVLGVWFVSYCSGQIMCVRDNYVCSGQLCVFGTAMCVRESYVCSGQLCVFGTAMCVRDSYVCSGQLFLSNKWSLFFCSWELCQVCQQVPFCPVCQQVLICP